MEYNIKTLSFMLFVFIAEDYQINLLNAKVAITPGSI